MEKNREIFVYITDNIDRVITGNPLALYITDENEKQQCIRDLEIALKADVIQLKNGDYILISR
ncbi:MAG: hypothetical protein E6600_11105 [Anaerocolumna aminovalerica]|uniref:capping complex subunit for YIEGIA n=1 Tax=Anaerocolumna aminovalerica TaxID=1527 RepID=UPI002915B179|nr:hypothetical protein [Anaerocolumna aminovalerica]MDU6265036.1 hypothetical protein [Anaerocolumna aminovalerica]